MRLSVRTAGNQKSINKNKKIRGKSEAEMNLKSI